MRNCRQEWVFTTTTCALSDAMENYSFSPPPESAGLSLFLVEHHWKLHKFLLLRATYFATNHLQAVVHAIDQNYQN